MQDAKPESSVNSGDDLASEHVDDYWSTYRQHVHTLLAWGYADALRRVQTSGQKEPDITGFMAEAIEDRFNSFDCPDWCNNISLKENHPVPGGGRAGNDRWRPDLIFESKERKPRPLYHFEAKRLNTQQSKSEYLGKDGLGCFLNGQYARDNSEAGMLGYIQSDDVNIWTERLQLAIEHSRLSKKNKLLVLSAPCAVQVIHSFPSEWISYHNRQTGTPITVHHILLDYRI